MDNTRFAELLQYVVKEYGSVAWYIFSEKDLCLAGLFTWPDEYPLPSYNIDVGVLFRQHLEQIRDKTTGEIHPPSVV